MSASAVKKAVGGIAPYVLALVVLVVGGGLSLWWVMNPAKAKRRRPPQQAALVETRTIELNTEHIDVEVMGTVVPVRQMRLAARVGGQVSELAPGFVPGGRFKSDQWIVKLEAVDTELAVAEAQAEVQKRAAELEGKRSDVAQRTLDVELAKIAIERAQGAVDRAESQIVSAESRLRIEMGLQSVAETDYQTVPRNVSPEERDLMLRQPQLRSAKADCDAAQAAKNVALADYRAAEAAKRTAEERKRAAEAAAQAAEATHAAAKTALRKANLDSERTTIKAPFNSMVLSKSIDVGSQIAVGSELASLVGTDAFWIQVSVPVDQLKWIDIPGINSDHGAAVKITHQSGWGAGVSRSGRVQQLMTDLETEGRMARLLVVVEDPLELRKEVEDRHPLILNSYVRVAIQGRPLDGVVRIPRTALRDGQRAWVATQDNKLDIRNVTIVWGGADHVLISSGLRNGDRLIESNLGTPVQNMLVRTNHQAPATPESPPESKE